MLSQNGASQLAETLRKALGWGLAPVITGFDPRFNVNRKLWFERAFDLVAGRPDALKPFNTDSPDAWVPL